MNEDTCRPPSVTALLAAWNAGDREAEGEVLCRTYPALRQIAEARMRRERSGHTLQPTALVHEAYLRLLRQQRVPCHNREQFFALLSTMMKRVLLDHARSHDREKHGAALAKLPLLEAEAVAEEPAEEQRIGRLVRELAAVDPLKAAVVELRYVAGLTLEEAAKALGCSRATVARHWRLARAWLRRELAPRRS